MDSDFVTCPISNFRCLHLFTCSKSVSFVNLHHKAPTRSTSSLFSCRLKLSARDTPTASESKPVKNFAVAGIGGPSTKVIEDSYKTPRNFAGVTWPKFLALGDKAETNDSKDLLKRYSWMLSECASKGSLTDGKAIHGNLIKSGIEPDSHLVVSLINFYAKCGNLSFARKMLDKMHVRDVMSWTALIAGVLRKGYGSDSLGLYYEMIKENVRPNEFTLATVLKACSMLLDLEFGKQIHVKAIKLGLSLDLFVGSALVDLYAKCGELEFADKLFSYLPEKNSVSWNALLHGYAQKGDGEEVLKLLYRMIECEMNFTEFTLSTALKGCANTGNLRHGTSLHSMAIRGGYESEEFLSCSLVDMYFKCGMTCAALKVFNTIKDPDIVAWSAVIAGLDQQGHSQEVAEMFNQMRRAGVRPNKFTLSSLVSAATDMTDLHFGTSIHACIYKCGFESDNSVGNALIMMYMKTGYVQDGTRVFDLITDRDIVSWNSLLSGFYNAETSDQGPKVFCQILLRGFKPNLYTFVGILRSCTSLLDLNFGKQVHAQIIKRSIDAGDFVGTALIDMYAKGRCLEDANVIFNNMIKRDIFTWTVMISGYAQTDRAEVAVKYIGKMHRQGLRPNEFTLASSLRACSHMATLENGRQLHCMAIKIGYFSNVFVSGSLVDMYGKCGCIEDAEVIFKDLASRDTVSWNIIISGYSQHGKGEKALEAFHMMLDEGILPDEVTFTAILSACSYMGWIEKGKTLFDLMNKAYGITPSLAHCACIVDMLGRAGRFSEVELFIEEMKLAPYSLIWETVLGSCKLYGHVDLGEKAARKLFDLEPKLESSYILLSNIFASKGRWDDVKHIRALMSAQGIKKEPGCSWVEVDGQFHVFLSQDDSHPKILEIHNKLKELEQKLSSAGYKEQTEIIHQNIIHKGKRQELYYHSERLALAFALVSANPIKPVRIFKNIRICGDCHDFMKHISCITNREIIVRDIKRFHNFTGGTCSCQDYW
ncbi:hypothetical protein K2173_011747 [Erythroxylum novogranatense]|uniref:DYW domain-containing protein n=1 Tax=Erythroxylum novogranatense TaxID=1862640 RepID=A0AAV8TLA2_9ROSI|nr:hypothetical protein K2173_011747 [Erythroxylum novogranatense]